MSIRSLRQTNHRTYIAVKLMATMMFGLCLAGCATHSQQYRMSEDVHYTSWKYDYAELLPEKASGTDLLFWKCIRDWKNSSPAALELGDAPKTLVSVFLLEYCDLYSGQYVAYLIMESQNDVFTRYYVDSSREAVDLSIDRYRSIRSELFDWQHQRDSPESPWIGCASIFSGGQTERFLVSLEDLEHLEGDTVKGILPLLSSCLSEVENF